MVHLECQVVHVMPHPPLYIWAGPRNWSLQPLYLSTFLLQFLTQAFQQILNYADIFPAIAQRSSNSDSLTCTSTAASIVDPGPRGVGCLGEWTSAPITVASEFDCGSSYASLSSSPMTASQSRKHCHLFSFCSSSWSICLVPSSFSSPHSDLASVVGGSGSHSSSSSSSSDVEELVGPQSCAPGHLLGAMRDVVG